MCNGRIGIEFSRVDENMGFIGATMIGLARNVIRNRAIHDARNMASARMELASAVKDGTDDIARCVSIIIIPITKHLNL